MKTKYRKLDAPDPSLKVFPKFASSFFFPKLKAEKEMIKVKLPSFNISKRLLREKSGTYRVSSFPSCFRSRCGAERSGSFLDPTSRSQWTYLNKRHSDNRKCMIYSLNWSLTWHRRLQKWRFKDLGKLFLLLLFSLDGKWTTWPKCDWIKAWTIGSMLMGEKPGKLSLLRFILTSLWSTLFSCGNGLLCNERLGGRREGVTLKKLS